VGHKIIFEDGKVCHRCVSHRRERVVAVFGYDNIASPGDLFLVSASLNVTNIFVDGKRHPVSRNGRIENDIWTCKFTVHSIESFNKLIMPLVHGIQKMIISVLT